MELTKTNVHIYEDTQKRKNQTSSKKKEDKIEWGFREKRKKREKDQKKEEEKKREEKERKEGPEGGGGKKERGREMGFLGGTGALVLRRVGPHTNNIRST